MALLIAILAWVIFGLADLARRKDIGAVKKTVSLLTFVVSGGIVLVVYGAVRFSRTGGSPGD